MTRLVARNDRIAGTRSVALLAVTSLYGLLYLWFVIVSLIPAPEGNWISTTVPFDPFDAEQIGVKLLFLFFLAGYIAVWRNEGVGGAIFLLWWIAMWCFELLVVAPVKGEDAGGGVVMGTPLFILGLLFVLRWFRKRKHQGIVPAPEN